VASLDELLEATASWMEKQVKENGAIVFKTTTWPIDQPDREKAQAALDKILAGEVMEHEEERELAVFLREADATNAGELGVPLAIHTGVWNDFRNLDARHLIQFIFRNPETRMDIYHLGIPNVRETLQIVKNFPNAYLNLCWAHIVASDMVVQTLKEAIDIVPLNKVFAFGADYIHFVEKVYGHLHMARENIAIALGDRVERNLMDLDEAKHILRAWFYDNPKEFYGL
jgi:predicted TIM-barrel fold metal-dependent hydrolase